VATKQCNPQSDPSPRALPTGGTHPWKGRSVAVLGATGFIGRWLASCAEARGAAVHWIVRDEDRARRLGRRMGLTPRVYAADVGAEAELEKLLDALAPDVVLNAIGYGVDPGERDEASAVALNADLPPRLGRWLAREAVRGAARFPVRLLHLGSALEYGEVGGDLAEDGPCRPTTLYGKTKLKGVKALSSLASAEGLPVLTVRLFTVFGPGEHAARLFPSLVRRARETGDLDLTSGEQVRDFSHVEDVAHRLLDLCGGKAPPGHVVNLASGVNRTVREFVLTAAAALGLDRERLRFGALPVRREEMAHDPVRLVRLRALGVEPPPADVARGVRRSLECWETMGDVDG